MDLRQLECFVTVAEERHFTRAAHRLHLVQSGLSQTIRLLEDELGGPLFVRTTRKVELTPAGKILLGEARRVLAAAREAQLAVTQVHGLARGQLRIGSILMAPFVDLPRSIGGFRKKYPGIDVELVLDGAAPLLQEVNEGRLDIAFTQPGDMSAGMTARMIACEDMAVICAPTHPLARQRRAKLAALTQYTFADLRVDWGMRRLTDSGFTAINKTRKIAFEVNDLTMLIDLVARGLGIALVPESVALGRQKDRRARPIAIVSLADREPLCWEVVVAYNGQNGVASDRIARAFVDLLVTEEGGPIQYQS
ncbi:MAG TPA: LysR family transcriptional regulator [Candidatus Methylacidiphilales bacterium]|jgi:DNA-binding transcriptional LysR family regulator|nr:LysR family transcriptional regulator [Candidatus Methylacidiphilales bacterium]